MKVRRGFVSNSSSSSYTCDVCSYTESGWDLCLSEAEMFECVNGHTVHEGCSTNFDDRRKQQMLDLVNSMSDERKAELEITQEIIDDPSALEEYLEEELEEWRYSAAACMCPVCTLDVLLVQDEVNFYRRKHRLEPSQTLQEIKDSFKTYKAFQDYLKNKCKKEA